MPVGHTPPILIITGFEPYEVARASADGIPALPLFMPALLGQKERICLMAPVLGAVAVATYLIAHERADVTLANFAPDTISFDGSEIVAISSTFMGEEWVRTIADAVREASPSAKIILGGPLSWSIPPEILLQNIPALDAIILREGEETFREMILALRAGSSLEHVNDIAFRHNNKAVITPRRAFLAMDSLPYPDWELLGFTPQGSDGYINVLPVETARGCIYNCAFCSEVHYWDKPVRHKSPQRVVEEFRRGMTKYGTRVFRIVDSCFTAPRRRCTEVCDAIYQELTSKGLGLRWTAYGRVNDLTPELLDSMKRAGCAALDIGVESGDAGILRSMNKGYTPADIINAARMAREAGIITHFNLVIGFPGETAETIENTIAVLNEAQPDTFGPYVLDVAPHTHIYENRARYGIIGERMTWEHRTMNSGEAFAAMMEVIGRVTNSTYFPGGEYFVGYLLALGYSLDEIRQFYRAVRLVWREGETACEGTPELSLVRQVGKRLGPFF
ncbi:MAG: radical SAM protein [Chloroflexi bacterium]|nr:radical SAM protein [Chloroflexota bacterium]